MIDPKELRQGNYIIASSNISELNAINFDNETYYCWMLGKGSKNISWTDAAPIPITPQWLERFGFRLWKKAHGTEVWEIDALLIFVVFNEHGFFVEFKESQLDHIKHIHQLQNLYFALTGEELTIKEDELDRDRQK